MNRLSKYKPATCLLVALIIGMLFAVPVLAFYGPVAYHTEQVYAHYDTDGTLSATTYTQCSDNSRPCRFGYLEVALPNINDTLQTVRINFSGTTDTNLDIKEAYKAVASSSGGIWAKTNLYFNTSGGGWDDPSYYYNITNATKAPSIQLGLGYSNAQGGYDLYDHDNIGSGGSINVMNFVFNITNPSATKALNSAQVILQFDKDTTLTNDALNIISAVNSSGTTTFTDGGGVATDLEKLTWTGDIAANTMIQVNFTANITETEHLGNGNTSMNTDSDLSDLGGKSSYSQVNALTGLTIAYKYARGPVRQGIDMFKGSADEWEIRGFIKVLAADSAGSGNILTYNISEWAIYNVSASTGNVTNKLQSGTYSSHNFTAGYGDLYTTDSTYSNESSRVILSGSTKPYVASSFDWHVFWNDTNSEINVSYINTTLDLPTLYKLDISPLKGITGHLSPGSAETLNITDTSEYQGDNNSAVGNIVILSVVPNQTNGGAARTYFSITNAYAYYYNGTENDITGNATVNITIIQPSSSSNGLVNLTITSLSQTDAGKNMSYGEKIILKYNVTTSADLAMNDVFNFTGNTTIVSESGTPMTENLPEQSLATSGSNLIAYKDLWIPDATAPTLVNGTLVVRVDGTVISGIKFVDYVPLGTNFSCSTSGIQFYNSIDGGSTWTVSTDISVSDRGNVTLPNGIRVHACEYNNSAGNGWSLDDDEAVRVSYLINITNSGLYEMPMELAGWDPALGKMVRTTTYGVIRVIVPSPMIEPTVTQTDFLTARTITIGNPVVWVKDFEVYNPNSRWVEPSFEIDVFRDTTDGFVSYLNEKGEKAEESVVFTNKDGKRVMTWKARLSPLETRSYEIRVLTPPVLETDRDVEVLRKLENKMVELRMSIFLRSLAEEDYENVVINLPISRDNILEVKDAYGKEYDYTGGEGSTTIIIDKFPAQALKEIIIRYKQSYPKIIITPNKNRYDLNSTVILDILVIHGGEELAYPYLETEIYTPGMSLVYSNIQNLGRLEPIDKTSVSELFRVPVGAPTGKYIAQARMRTDLATLATGTGNFYIVGAAGYTNTFTYLILFFAFVVLYISVKRLYLVKKQTK